MKITWKAGRMYIGPTTIFTCVDRCIKHWCLLAKLQPFVHTVDCSHYRCRLQSYRNDLQVCLHFLIKDLLWIMRPFGRKSGEADKPTYLHQVDSSIRYHYELLCKDVRTWDGSRETELTMWRSTLRRWDGTHSDINMSCAWARMRGISTHPGNTPFFCNPTSEWTYWDTVYKKSSQVGNSCKTTYKPSEENLHDFYLFCLSKLCVLILFVRTCLRESVSVCVYALAVPKVQLYIWV